MLETRAMDMYKTLKPLLPAGWERLALRGNVGSTFFDFVFYVKVKGEASYRQCYDMADAGAFTDRQLMTNFKKLFEICLKSHSEHEEGQTKVWTTFTFVLQKTGDFSIDYGYGEHELGVSDAWEKRYLI